MFLSNRLGNIRVRSFIVATVVSGVLLMAIVTILAQYVREREQARATNLAALANGELMALRAGIESSLYQRLSLPIALKAFVLSKPDFTVEDFERFAGSLKDSVPGVMSLQLAPDAVVTFLTDRERNSRALGHDLLGDEARRPAVVRSIEERRFIVAGPLNLLQGGRAIIARLPIFINGHRGKTEFKDFWGFATILINVDALFEDAGLSHIDPNIDIAIRGVDGLGAEGAMIHGDSGVFDRASRTVEVVLPNGSWQIASATRPIAVAHSQPFLLVGAAIFTCFLVGLAWALIYRQGSRELVRAKEEAEAASKLKSDFIAVMSHEMRTPLNGVLGVLDLLGRERLTPKQAEYVRTATISGEHLLRQINDVLDISRIESGTLTVQAHPLRIEKIIEDVVDINRTIAEGHGTKIRYELDLPDRRLAGDSLRIRQVLINLVGNAAKFTRDGEIVVSVKTLGETEEGAELEFNVTDTGIGIAPEQQYRIFDDFVTLDAGYDRETCGSGLGLAISRRLVSAMGGEIGLESTKGEGTRFWFRLPHDWADTVATGEATPPAGTEHLPHRIAKVPAAGPLDILMVEDNETNRFVAGDILRLAGHRVHEASDGREGVNMAAARAFDLILMDISMPKMDGVEATRLIRASVGPNRVTPIIGLTAHALAEERQKFLDAGLDGCILKPIRLQALYDALGLEFEARSHLPDADTTPTPVLIDESILNELSQVLLPERAAQTIQRVCDEIEAEVPAIAKESGGAEQIGKRAHKLAGSAAIVGAEGLAGLLRTIETAAMAGEDNKIHDALGELPEVARLTTSALLRRVPLMP